MRLAMRPAAPLSSYVIALILPCYSSQPNGQDARRKVGTHTVG